MTQQRSVRLLVALVVLVALAGAYWVLRGKQQASQELRRVLLDVDAQLAQPLDGSSLGALVLRLNNLPDADRNPQLIRVRARIRLAQGRFDRAWEIQAGLAEAVDAEAEDLWLGAQILARRHALGGNTDDARRAGSLAERHHGQTSQPGSLLLAWQCFHRAGDLQEERRLAGQLVADHPDSLEVELLRAWSAALFEDQAQRPTLQALRDLEIRFDQTPVELEILMIVGLLESQDEIDLGESVDRLQRLLESHQAVVDLRHYAAVAAYLQGEVNTRNAHLDWLLQNAPQDPRRPRWTELRRFR